LKWDDSLFAYKIGGGDLDLDDRDSAALAPLAQVVDTAFTWGEIARPKRPGNGRSSMKCTSKASRS
jgi:glycogen operon protein